MLTEALIFLGIFTLGWTLFLIYHIRTVRGMRDSVLLMVASKMDMTLHASVEEQSYTEIDQLLQRSTGIPFNLAKRFRNDLEVLRRAGFLERDGRNLYTLTIRGRARVANLLEILGRNSG